MSSNTNQNGLRTLGLQKPRLRTAAVAAAFAMMASAGLAPAAVYQWDPGMTPVTATGGNGAWDLSHVYWSDGANDFIWNNTTTDTASFGGTGGTVSTGAAIQANGLTFGTAGYTLTNGAGGSLALVGTTPTVTTNADATINAAIGGTAGLLKAGSGVLTLGGVNTYIGNTTLSAGKLALASGASLNSASSLVVNGASTLDLGGNSQTVANLSFGTNATAYTAAFTNGSLTVANANGVTLSSSNAAAGSTTLLDLSGLTSFTVNLTTAGKTFLLTNGSAGGVTPAAMTQVTLGGTNTITASIVQIGNGVGANGATPFHTAQLDLGQTNTINTDSLLIGAYRGTGAVDFRSGLIGATLTLRGYNGTGAVGSLIVEQSQNGVAATSTMNLSGGSVDAIITSGIVSQTNSNGPATGILSLAGGTSTFGAMNLANSLSTGAVATVNGTVNQNAGTIVANTVNFALQNPASGTFASNLNGTYNLGVNGATPSSATLSAGAINLLSQTNTAGLATGARQVINFNNGVIANYDPALGQSGAAAAVGSPTTASDLLISGTTGGGAGGNNSTLTINLAATGTHSLRAGVGHTITVASTALITGGGSLTADGPGTVYIRGAETFTGGTAISAGTLVTGNTAALGSGAVSVGAAGTLAIGDGTADALGGIGGLSMSNGATLKLGGVDSAITLAGGLFTLGNVQVDLNNLYNGPGTYTLINGLAGANSIGAATFLHGDTVDYNYSFAVSGNKGVLNVTAVPEPAVLGSIALATVVGLRRRRRS